MLVLTDPTGYTVSLPHPARRIISLVPSQTELLADLGLEEEVVGITKFCVHPQAWFRSKPRIGGTKQVHPDRIAQLYPDLIIANKEENVKEQVAALREKYPVYTSDVSDLSDALHMIKDIGLLTGRQPEARNIADEISHRFGSIPIPVHLPGVAYLIWNDPMMTVGHDTFIHQMLQAAGFRNVFDACTRYPSVTLEEIASKKPSFLFLSSEPYPFKEKHLAYFQKAMPGVQVKLVDGEMFSWYGSRLRLAPAYFNNLLSGR